MFLVLKVVLCQHSTKRYTSHLWIREWSMAISRHLGPVFYSKTMILWIVWLLPPTLLCRCSNTSSTHPNRQVQTHAIVLAIQNLMEHSCLYCSKDALLVANFHETFCNYIVSAHVCTYPSFRFRLLVVFFFEFPIPI